MAGFFHGRRGFTGLACCTDEIEGSRRWYLLTGCQFGHLPAKERDITKTSKIVLYYSKF
jgi:hypothetical protein